MFMLDCYIFSEDDLALNSTVPLWPIKINPVFDVNDEVMFIYIFASVLSDIWKHL